MHSPGETKGKQLESGTVKYPYDPNQFFQLYRKTKGSVEDHVPHGTLR